MGTYRRSAGFTLVELVVCLFLVVLLIAVIAPMTCGTRRVSGRVRCGSNLRQIGQAMLLYANENNGNYPRTRWKVGAPATQFTGSNATDPFASDGPADNDVTAAVFLLLRTQDITSSVFVCDSDWIDPWNYDGKGVQQKSNFPGLTTLSYSFHNMYPGPEVVEAKWTWTNTLKADFAIAADMNPGLLAGTNLTTIHPNSRAKDQEAGNSPNHARQGQNILYGDGHVDFSQTCFAGYNQDNIYGPSAGVLRTVNGVVEYKPEAVAPLEAPMVHVNDSVLLPTAIGKPAAPPRPIVTATSVPYAIAAVVVMGVLGAVVWLIVRQGPKARG